MSPNSKKSERKTTRKRSKSGQMPQILHFKPRNLAYINIEGRKRYLGIYGSPEAEAERLRIWTEYVAGKRIQLAPGEPMTVAILVHRFLLDAKETYVKHGRPTKTVNHFKVLVRPLVRLYGRTPVDQFTPSCLKAVRKYLLENGYRRKRHDGTFGPQRFYCREKINERIYQIRQIFKWGVESEIVPETTWRALTAVSSLKIGRTTAHEMPDVKAVRDWVVDATLPLLPPVVGDIVRLQRLTGMRPGEVIAMRPCDIYRSDDDFPDGYDFPPFGDLWVYIPEEHKTEHYGKIRFAFLGAQCQELLAPYMTAKGPTPESYLFSPQDSMRLFQMEKRAARKTRVQPSQVSRAKPERKCKPGLKYTTDSYRQAVQRAVERYNKREALKATTEGRKPKLLPMWFPNQLRHAKATEVRAIGGAEAAQVVLGHSRLQTTEVYAEKVIAKAIEIANAHS